MNALEGTLATVADLAAYIGEPISDEVEQQQAEALLAQASSLVRSEARQPTWGFNREGKVPEAAFWVTLACAARGYTNFEGFEYESVDDWRAGGRKVEEAGLFLTATERRTLQELRPARGPLGTVSTYRDFDTDTGTIWTPVEGTRSKFPW
ncbi:hypothetical protein [Trueperella pyogenes]